ncbi:MAG TPA: LysR family transcriptional regulator [Polyangiales bacterium]|nr:LysR family transcriptional regulator [Polyangiales bacterium]
MDFRGVDLNLLLALDILLAERHVTRAAERLGVSQPAMSASLARLRVVFGDQILVRSAKGLTATPRAERLREPLAQMMTLLGDMLAVPPSFAPATSQRTFTLIGTDFVELILLPSLMAMLTRDAPRTQVHLKGPDFNNLESRLATDLDLAVGYCPAASDALIKRSVFVEPFVCIARDRHPRLAEGLSLERYVELAHVQALPLGSTMYAAAIDTALAQLGLVRTIALWEPGFLAIASVVATTDLISTVPARVAAHVARSVPIAVHELPLPVASAEFAMYWHPRCQDDPGHKWLRDYVAEALR